MPYLDLRGMKTFKDMQDELNASKFAQLENGLVKNEQLIDSLADDIVMVHVDSTDVNNPILYRDKNGQQSEDIVTGEFDKLYINVDSDKMGYYYWNGARFILQKVSENALNDVNGNAITGYLRTFTLVNNKITVTNGAGVSNEFTIQSKEYNKATVSEDGLLSKEDKMKLDGIEEKATRFNLNPATSNDLGGVKIGSNITNTEGTISVTKQNVLDALTYTPANINDVTRAYLISTIGYAGYTIKSA